MPTTLFLVTTQPLTAKERIEHIETVFLLRSLRSLAVKNDEAEQLPFLTVFKQHRHNFAQVRTQFIQRLALRMRARKSWYVIDIEISSG